MDSFFRKEQVDACTFDVRELNGMKGEIFVGTDDTFHYDDGRTEATTVVTFREVLSGKSYVLSIDKKIYNKFGEVVG